MIVITVMIYIERYLVKRKSALKLEAFVKTRLFTSFHQLKTMYLVFLKMYLTMEIFYKEFCIQTVLF